MISRPSRVSAVGALSLFCVGWFCVGCSGEPSPPAPAPRAGEAACRALLARLPERVLGSLRTPLDVAGAAEWGSPPVVARCGLADPGPTTAACLTVDDTDWVVDDGSDPLRFITFGRSPALEVRVPLAYGRANATGALVDLGPAVAALPTTGRRCTDG